MSNQNGFVEHIDHTVQTIVREVSVLSLLPTDILCVTLSRDIPTLEVQRIHHLMRTALNAHGIQNLVLLIPPGVTVTRKQVEDFAI